MQLSWIDAIKECHRRAEPWVLATIISTQGSTPRDSGSKLVISEDKVYDTLGGGQLEFSIILRARDIIRQGKPQHLVEHIPLSAKVQQCCGGAVDVLFEYFPAPTLAIHVFGAGHVARALLPILSALDARLIWIDSRRDEFPQTPPPNTRVVCQDNIVDHVNTMEAGAYAIILSHQHSLDYQLCEALLDRQDCAYIGLIGSHSKAMRFRHRLKSAAFKQEDIDAIYCPIGIREVGGKLPMEVAVAIAAQVIQHYQNARVSTPGAAKKLSGLSPGELRELTQP